MNPGEAWHKTLSSITEIIIIGFFLSGFYVAYLGLWPFEIVSWKDGMIPIAIDRLPEPCEMSENLPVFYPGDIVPLRFRGVKNMRAVGVCFPRLINDIVIVLPEIRNPRDPGPFDYVSLNYKVPKEVRPGVYRFELTWIWRPNPLRTITDKRSSMPFKVREAKGKKK